MIEKELKHELEVGASADEIWGVYSSPDLNKYLLVELLPGVFEKHQVLHGDGDVGTIIFVKFVPGIVPRWFKEKFVTVDHKKRLMEVEMIEGGYLLMGCTFYMDTIHILEKGPDSCVILSKVTYQVPNEEIERKVAPYISTASLASMATAISNYVMNKRKKLLHELQVAASAKDEYYWDVYSNPSDMPKLVLQLLPIVFKEMEIAKSNDGRHGVHELRIAVPPGTNNEEKLYIWSGKVISFKQCCLILMFVVSLVIVVSLVLILMLPNAA